MNKKRRRKKRSERARIEGRDAREALRLIDPRPQFSSFGLFVTEVGGSSPTRWVRNVLPMEPP